MGRALCVQKLGGALHADRTQLLFVVQLRAMLHKEAADTGELVCLRRQNDDVEVEVRKVLTGELKAAGVVGIVDIHLARHLVRDAFLQGLDALRVIVGLAGCVVIGCHAHPLL
jgi:uncharacterized membrane protein YedE/YeeE